eukprot:PLAT3693.7.p1 GENE.PLAT3693.7~~PLAT3693.7.p1  ORF type:complete len:1062 (-),score=601.39 PLAT3693.7:763-3516(-)
MAQHAALRCVGFTLERMDTRHLSHSLSSMLPCLVAMFCSDSYEPPMRSRALTVLLSPIQSLGWLASAGEEGVVDMIEPVLPELLTTCAEAIESEAAASIRMAALKLVLRLFNGFRYLVSPYLPMLWAATWHALQSSLAAYHSGESVLSGEDYDSDGDLLGVEPLVVQLIEFVRTVFGARADELMAAVRDSLDELVYVITGYMLVNDELLEAWEDDPAQYISAEDEHSDEPNVRNLGLDTLKELVVAFGRSNLDAMLLVSTRRLTEAEETADWRPKEVALLMLGHLADVLQEMKPPPLDIHELTAMLMDTVESGDSALLVGRALWCLSRFTHSLSEEQVPQLLAAVAASLQAEQPLPVKLHACRALGGFLSKTIRVDPSAELLELLPVAVEAVVGMLHDAEEETVLLVLETMISMLRVSADVTTALEVDVTPLLVELWMQFFRSNVVAETIMGAFTTMARMPSCSAGLEQRLLPAVMDVLRAPADYPSGMLTGGVDLLNVMVENAPEDDGSGAGEALYGEALPLLLSMLYGSDDGSLLQSAVDCLASYVRVASTRLTEGFDEEGKAYVDRVLHVLEHMLHPDTDETACLYVGALLSATFDSFGEGMDADLMGGLLAATLQRLATAQRSTLKHGLLFFVVRLLAQRSVELLDVLSAISVGDEDGLSFFLQFWSSNARLLRSRYHCTVSCTALAKLVTCGDPRIEGARVLVRSADSGSDMHMAFMLRGISLLAQGLPKKSTGLGWQDVLLVDDGSGMGGGDAMGADFFGAPGDMMAGMEAMMGGDVDPAMREALMHDPDLMAMGMDMGGGAGMGMGMGMDDAMGMGMGGGSSFAMADDALMEQMYGAAIDPGLLYYAEGDGEEDDEEDPRQLADPLNEIDINELRLDFFSSLAATGAGFERLVSKLPVEDQAAIEVLLGG